MVITLGLGIRLRLTAQDFFFLLCRTIRLEMAEVARYSPDTEPSILIGRFNALITAIIGIRTVGLFRAVGDFGYFTLISIETFLHYLIGNRSGVFGTATNSWLRPTPSAGMMG